LILAAEFYKEKPVDRALSVTLNEPANRARKPETSKLPAVEAIEAENGEYGDDSLWQPTAD
jgi:hypothetical protein